MKVLVVDVGGSHIKVLATGRKTPIDNAFLGGYRLWKRDG
jgi:hypothetical protein